LTSKGAARADLQSVDLLAQPLSGEALDARHSTPSHGKSQWCWVHEAVTGEFKAPCRDQRTELGAA